MKNKLGMKITGAVLAVIFTAGLGTAALASSEPSRELGQPAQQTEITLPERSDRGFGPAMQEEGASAAPDAQRPQDVPAEPSGEPSEESG